MRKKSNKELSTEIEALTNALADRQGPAGLKNEAGDIVKLFSFDDPVNLAFENALSANVFHPQGNVDDPVWQDDWRQLIAADVARDLGLQLGYVSVTFHSDDRNGVAFEDGNMVRVMLRAGSQIRHTLLSDPTPED